MGIGLSRAVGGPHGAGGTGSTRGDLLKGGLARLAPCGTCSTARSPQSCGVHLALLPPPQSLMDAQNSRIEELLQKIKQQQYKLDKQNLQIKSLQSKVSSCPALR